MQEFVMIWALLVIFILPIAIGIGLIKIAKKLDRLENPELYQAGQTVICGSCGKAVETEADNFTLKNHDCT